MTHLSIGKLTIIGSDNGLAPGRHCILGVGCVMAAICLSLNVLNICIPENASENVIINPPSALAVPVPPDPLDHIVCGFSLSSQAGSLRGCCSLPPEQLQDANSGI